MRPVYATRFDIEEAPGSASPKPSLDGVRRIVLDWTTSWYQRRGIALPILDNDARVEPAPVHRIELRTVGTAAGAVLWTFYWQYPADLDPTLVWSIVCQLVSDDTGLEFSVVVRVGSSDFTVKPVTYDIYAPKIVSVLIDRYSCTVAARRLHKVPHLITLNTIDDFIQKTLLDSARKLPVVVYAREHSTNRFLADPYDAAQALSGLADVWALNDKWTSFALVHRMGKPLACFGGAVRVYWPGFTLADEPRSHLLLIGPVVEKLERDPSGVARHLFRRLAPISALRFVEGPRVRFVREAIDRERQAEVAAIREAVRTGSESRDKLEEQLLEALIRVDDLSAERDSAQVRVLELEDLNQQLRDNFALVEAHVAVTGSTEGPTAPPTEEAEALETVQDALIKAEGEFPRVFEVFDSARDSALESAYARPDHVYEALLAIEDVARLVFNQRAQGGSIGPLEELFEQRGFKYTASEHQVTMTMYGDSRKFTHRGKSYEVQRHVTLGGGDRQNCLQIYFEFDQRQRRILVAYCGPHLEYYGMRT